MPFSIDDASHPDGPRPGVPHRAAFGIRIKGDGEDVDQPVMTSRSRE